VGTFWGDTVGGDDGCLLGLEDGLDDGNSELTAVGPADGPAVCSMVGCSVVEMTGKSVEILLGIMLVDGANGGLPLGMDDESRFGLRLGSKLNDGTELGAELGEITGMSVRPLLGE
jgi:hypothetical protein